MIPSRNPRFSPPPSEVGDRATSPALSSSSRAASSIPTDFSDISSLDGDDEDYEVVETPFLTQHGDDMVSSTESNSIPYHRDSTIASEIEESSFLAPVFQHADTHQEQIQDDQGSEWGSLHQGLHASTSLTTLNRMDNDADDTLGSSSLLRFPDPLHESFQGVNKTVNDGIKSEEKGRKDEVDFATPKLLQQDQASGEGSLERALLVEDVDSNMKKALCGLPFSWNKKVIVENVLRAVLGLIVIIISTGVLPSWYPNSIILQQNRTSSSQRETSLLGALKDARSLSCSQSATGHFKATKALMIKPSSNVSVFSSASSFMVGPTGRGKGKRRTKEVLEKIKTKKTSALRIRECQSLSVYDSDAFSIKRAIYATVPVSPASFESANADFISKHMWESAIEKSRTARDNAKAISTKVRKEWQDWVDDMNHWYGQQSFPIAQMVLKTAYQPVWKQILNRRSELIRYLKKSWLNWMQEAHQAIFMLRKVWARESIRLNKDYQDVKQYAYSVFVEQSNHAAKAARQTRENADEYLKQSVLPAVDKMQTGVGKASKQAINHMQKGMEAATLELLTTKKALQKRAKEMKEKRMESATRMRLMEVGMMREKHRQLMKIVEEQNRSTFKAKQLIKRGKVGLYRKAIQSVRAKHQFEDILSNVGSHKKVKLPRVKHTWKNSRKSFKGAAGKFAQSQRKLSKKLS